MAVSRSTLASLLKSMGAKIFLQNTGLCPLSSQSSFSSLQMFMSLFPSVSVIIVLPHQYRTGSSANNLWRLIQPEKITEQRVVMAPHHNEIWSHRSGGSRDLLSRFTGGKKRLAVRILRSYLTC